MRTWPLLLVVTGCSQLLGLHDLPVDAGSGALGDATDGATADANPLRVTVRSELLYIDTHADGTLAPLAVAPAPQTATVTLDDGTVADVATGSDGELSFALAHAGQAYRLRVLGSGAPAEYQLDQTSVVLDDTLAGHQPPPPPLTGSATLAIAAASLPSGTATYRFVTTGVWADGDVTLDKDANAVDVAWASIHPLSGPAGELSAARGDQIYVVRTAQATNAVTGGVPANYDAITHVYSAPVTLASGGSATVSGTLAAVVPLCANLVATQTGDAARVLATYGNTSVEYQGSVDVIASPSTQLGATAALPITTATTVAGLGESPQDVDLTETYGNPFQGTVVSAASFVEYVYAVGSGNALLGNALTYSAPLVADDTCATTTFPTGGPLATALMLGTTSLAADGATVAIGSDQDAVLTWSVDGSPAPDAYTVSLEQVGATATVTQRWLTIAPSVVIERGTLAPGTTYVFRIDAQVGLPGAAAGDWTQSAPSGITGTTHSHPFAVTATP